jgi:hypothetical protein
MFAEKSQRYTGDKPRGKERRRDVPDTLPYDKQARRYKLRDV